MNQSTPLPALPKELLPKSLSLLLEVTLKESALKNPTQPTLDRTLTTFRTLQTLIPHLGIHQHLMGLIVKELEASCFTNEGRVTGFSDGTVQAIPYFTMIDRVDRI